MAVVTSWTPRAVGAAVVLTLMGCGGGSPLTLSVSPPGASTRADGVTPAVITIKVTKGDKAIPDSVNGSVKVTTDKGQFIAFDPAAPSSTPDDTGSQLTTVPINSGAARVQLFSLRSGQATVNFTYSDDNAGTATKQVTVAFGTVSNTAASIQYVDASPATINLAGSGGVTTSQVTFKVLDASGSPAGDGIVVTFSLSQNPGGAAIAPLTATTANGTGRAQTVLSAGTIPGTVVITASAGSVTTQSQPIPISGGKVNFKNFSLACDVYSIGGFSYFGLNNHCTVFASDVNKQFVSGTQIQLLSEAGQVPANLQINPDPATSQGTGTFVYQTACPLPVDVAPKGGEYSKANAQFFNMCKVVGGVVAPGFEPRTVNPRDGIASLVAYTTGEECYNDKNGNGKFDPGEEDLARCDLGEPFLDENDNGKWDGPGVDPAIPAGEPFFDFDNNGTWTGPNGKWDGQWPIWRSVTITWTGKPDGTLTQPIPANPFPSPPPLPHNSTARFDFQFADINGNCPTAASPSDTLSVDCGNTNCRPPTSVFPEPIQDCNSAFVDSNKLPAFHILADDAHDPTCTPTIDASGNPINFTDGGPATPCPAGDFTMTLSFSRTLAADISGAVGGTGTAVDTYSGVVSGVFQ
jgi:hypothetical protein